MTHLVSPTSFRLGKTHSWKLNSIPSTIISTNVVSTYAGLTNLLKIKLRRKRLLIVKSCISTKSKHIKIHSLFMPKMKTKPKSDGLGTFSKYILYKNYNQNSLRFLKKVKGYTDERRQKNYRFPQKKYMQINKWLSRRMFRGAISLKYKKKFRLNYLSTKKQFNYNSYIIKLFKKRRWRKKQYKKKFKIKSKKIYRSRSKKLARNTYWWRSRLRYKNISQGQKLSHYLSSVLNKQITIKIANIFYYLAVKQMIKFRTHQEHFWNRRFRRFRFQYNNYYDIINSFFILGLVKNSENLLLSILRMMMPRIRKIRRFMYFLDAILKNLPQIQANFSCFRITITGKTQGGTKRTKTFSIGYGHLPYQSLYLDGTTAFTSYRHKFGEFGVKLTMNRTYIKIYKNVTKQWVINKDPSPLAYILEPEKKLK